jgi:hypothetical protein
MVSRNDEKNFGPHIAGMMLGVCLGSYIEYGVTKEELLALVAGMYDGIVAQISEQDLEPGFGDLTDERLDAQVARLKNMVTNNQLPEERGAALWYLLGQFEDELARIKVKM